MIEYTLKALKAKDHELMQLRELLTSYLDNSQSISNLGTHTDSSMSMKTSQESVTKISEKLAALVSHTKSIKSQSELLPATESLVSISKEVFLTLSNLNKDNEILKLKLSSKQNDMNSTRKLKDQNKTKSVLIQTEFLNKKSNSKFGRVQSKRINETSQLYK